MTDNRQTVFPGIWVAGIEVEKPPFDEPGVVQEFVGRGVVKDFEVLKRSGEFTEENVGEFLQDAEEMIGPLRDTYRIKYDLRVRAISDMGVFSSGGPLDVDFVDHLQSLQDRSVSARARSWARVKNPFEPDVFEVGEPSKNKELTDHVTGEVYDVTVSVTK
jgi:hypothetical protein